MGYLYLAIAIAGEILGTTMLKYSQGFTKLLPSAGVVLGYGFAFYCLSLALKTMPLGVSYAIWSGVGTALTAIIGFLLWKEKLSAAGVAGIVFIILGVALLNISSNTHA
ncbi:multidrug efflux SMR transporter [Paenibacillus sp. FJAT-26967]|uniref:DMT family transporter n=1 Tax=Paenibacillus sp. FJAT-26967 TaxID=1729690 RepID=UPI000837C752|nr:multidrug efflux SMR transporter [Paenibacillus sp. FJAT-26967]